MYLEQQKAEEKILESKLQLLFSLYYRDEPSVWLCCLNIFLHNTLILVVKAHSESSSCSTETTRANQEVVLQKQNRKTTRPNPGRAYQVCRQHAAPKLYTVTFLKEQMTTSHFSTYIQNKPTVSEDRTPALTEVSEREVSNSKVPPQKLSA